MSAWDSAPPDYGPSRDAWTLKQIDDNNFTVDLVPIQTEANGHTGTFYVTGDNLMVEGIRVPVSARLQQLICDRLGLVMLTPRLSDLIHEQRGVTVLPLPRPITSKTAASLDQSAKIDAAIAAAGGRPEGTAVSSTGKDWVLVKSLANKPGKAANLGWYFPGASFQGLKGEASVSIPGQRLIQGVGTVHGSDHTDYSQLFRAVSRNCVVDGQDNDTAAVLMDPQLAPLISHEGALPFYRQPGLDESPPAVDLPAKTLPVPEPPAATSEGASTVAKVCLIGAVGTLAYFAGKQWA